jgi:B12-binding domain/radical SAM domain protein
MPITGGGVETADSALRTADGALKTADGALKTADGALAFVFEHDNIQSISALIGAIETDGRFDDLEIRLLRTWSDLGEQVEGLAVRYRKVVVGFSFTTPRAEEIVHTVRRMRRHLRSRCLENVTLVAGGPHPSGDWRQTLGMGFDVVVVGEGESSFVELLACLYGASDFGHIGGLAYRRGPLMHCTGRSTRVEDLDLYPPFADRFNLFSSIEITRGCPWACKYCQATFLFGGRMRHRSVENVVKWVEASKRRDRLDMRFITPDAFAYGSEGGHLRLELLAELLKRVNAVVGREHTYLGSFPSEVRPDSVSREAVELVRHLTVNDNILIGAQSGSQRMLDLAHRGHTVDDIYRAVRIVLDVGFIANVDFIFGMPGETEQDRRRTLRVIEDLAAMGARIHSHTFMPLAGTPWANSPPGTVDEETRLLLESLTSKGQHFGQWRKQREAARAIAGFRETC